MAILPSAENQEIQSMYTIHSFRPLVQQTLRDCLNEVMDIEGLERLLGPIARGETRVIARNLTNPSPLISKDLET
jgi:Lhr-like helicase